MNTKLNAFRQEGGFTLIEMLIVVAIISILVAIAVPALNTAKQEAQEAKRDAISASVATAKVRYALAEDGTEGTAANFAQFSKYLLVNGAVPSSPGVLANVDENGAGQNITGWGTYPSSTDGTATEVEWSDGAALTE
jgi:prepilin-type N-terminal cleavage/methylation domain-containing protein